MKLFSLADYGNGWNRIGQDLQAASATSGGINHINTYGIRRVMPFAQWDRDKNGVIETSDVEALQAASIEAGDPNAADWPEVFEFLDVGVNLQNTGLVGSVSITACVPGGGQPEYMCDFMCPVENPVSWRNNPPTYTCLESCALVYGGEAVDYSCSTVDTFVDNQAYYQVYGASEAEIVAEDFTNCDAYTASGCKTAYVGDHLWIEDVNYCWSNAGGGGLSEAALDGRVTLPEYEAAMDGIADGSRFEPGWLQQIETVASEIAAARSHEDELIIVSVHWGGNYSPYTCDRTAGCDCLICGGVPAEWQPAAAIQTVAHALIDAGVDIIHGGSAHHTLGVEIYQQKPIIYGTGALVDDYSYHADVRNDLSLLYNVHVETATPRRIRRLELVPLKRHMGISHLGGYDSPGLVGGDAHALQSNLMGRNDPDWELLRAGFSQLCAAFGGGGAAELETVAGSANFIINVP